MKKCSSLIAAFLLSWLFASEAGAGFVNVEQARLAAQNWLVKNVGAPMDTSLGQNIRQIKHYYGEKYGNAGYYAVFLDPQGWIIIPTDDSHEAILAFRDRRNGAGQSGLQHHTGGFRG